MVIEKRKFLDKAILNSMKDFFISDTFPWFYAPYQTKEGKDSGYMYHSFYRNNFVNSNYYSRLSPLVQALNVKAIVNLRANLTLKQKNKNYSDWHIDHYFIKNPKHKTAIFYLNTNNGYTEFKNGKKIMSEENKIAIFDVKEEHRAVSQTDENCRIVFNLNYYE